MSSVEVVIAVHNTGRPIERSVGSVLAAGARARALVVAHGVPAEQIAAKLAHFPADRVRVMAFADGIKSPAGPFNAGLAATTAPYVAVLGSDDELDPGALDAALQRIESFDAEVCILPQRFAGSERRSGAPLVRAHAPDVLDFVRDRLCTRTAPLAVFTRDALASIGPLFDPRFQNGEDIAAGIRLWSGFRCTYRYEDPAYVIHADAQDRVTDITRDDLQVLAAAPLSIAAEPWLSALSRAARISIGAKMIRTPLLAIVSKVDSVSEGEITLLQTLLRAWTTAVPECLRACSRAERRVLDAIAAGDRNAFRSARDASRNAGWWNRYVPRNPFRAFDRDGTLRRYIVYAQYRRLGRQ